jgi:hypothetical protein
MAEILVKAQNLLLNDGMDHERYQRGYPVVVMEDGHRWGREETLPKFIVIKIPGVPAENLRKYMSEWIDNSDPERPRRVNRRLWKLRWDDLPQRAKNRLAEGVLVIKAIPSYTGPYDYMWLEIRSYFRNQLTNTNEGSDI